MKKLLSILLATILLATILLLTCIPALAEESAADTVFREKLGVTLNLGAMKDKCANAIVLGKDWVASHNPFVSMSIVDYYAIPQAELDQIDAEYDQLSEEEQLAYNDYLYHRYAQVACIIVTDTTDQAAWMDAVGIQADLDIEVSEFASLDSWHYYLVTAPADELPAFYDDPEIITEDYTEEMARADQETVKADIELLQSGLLEQLQAAEVVAPADPSGNMPGQILEFETTDLDGNPVSSADLFKDNKVTMVNVWGVWCGNCLYEMAELAQLHNRLQEKGCGIVGLEFEKKPIEEMADTARAVMTANGVTYPNAIMPKGNAILDTVYAWPTTFFVDSEGRILTYPIVGAAVKEYEPTMEALLAGESVEIAANTGAAANGDNKYCVYVYDADGNPVEGAYIQFCDDTFCAFQPTDANGLAEFTVDVEKVYEVHVLQAPEGYLQDESTYETMDSYSDVSIFLERAE